MAPPLPNSIDIRASADQQTQQLHEQLAQNRQEPVCRI